MEYVDITIIGAGVIGLAIATEAGRLSKNVLLLEKNESWGQETSSRNSEVIHAGIYYKPGSLKAISCVEGRKMLYKICEEHSIPCRKTGKIIVAVDHDECDILMNLNVNAKRNGVETKFLDKKGVHKMEPSVSCQAALYSPETGIVDSHALMEYFLKKSQDEGVDVVYKAEVMGIEWDGSRYTIKIDNQGEKVYISSKIVINCAGHNADKIASLTGIDIEKEGYQQCYTKGNYFRVSDKFVNVTHHLVYPVPLKTSLGIHTVLDLRGGVRLGPDDEEVEDIDYNVDENKKRAFYEFITKFIPDIEEDWLSPDMAGVRAQLRNPTSDDFRDFIISHEDSKGFPGLFNLIGIESPGLTSSPYIARYISKIADKYLKSI